MSNDLIIGGPRTIGVLTSALIHESLQCRRLGSDLGEIRRRLGGIDRMIGAGIIAAADAPRSVLQAEAAIDDARHAVRAACELSEVLADGLARAADAYQWAEGTANRIGQELAARMAWTVGYFLPAIAALLLPGAIMAGAVGAGALLALGEEKRTTLFTVLGRWMRQNGAGLSDGRFVDLVRTSVMSADDFGGGFAHLPPELVHLLGDEGFGIFGVDTSAGVVGVVAGGVGLLREGPVAVKRVSTVPLMPEQPTSVAAGVESRADRIPQRADQIRIDRYTTPDGQARFEVYLAGTKDMAAGSGSEPWDMTSNVAALANRTGADSAGSYRAAVQAMRDAGVSSATPVTLTGYSQGGLLAAELAASGEYRVDGLVTFGAPAGQVAVPHDIPYLAIEHNNDLVPALGGTFASSEPVIVRRELSPTELAGPAVLPAHELSNYRETARLIDGSTDERLARLLGRVNHSAATPVSSTLYRATRETG